MIDRTSPPGSWAKMLKLELGPWRKIDENTYTNRAKGWDDHERTKTDNGETSE